MRRKLIYCLLIAVVLMQSCGGGATNPDNYEVWGLDISKHQKKVDWEEVTQNERPHFVFLKATEGTIIVDPTYDQHSDQLDDLGILRGAYHFFGHRTSGKEQARNFIKTAKLSKGNLFPVLDIEWHRFMKDPKRSVREAKAFCREIKRYYGVNPIVYCSTNFYNTHLLDDFCPTEFPLWIADYSGYPAEVENWYFWQHTEKYKMKGIRGNVDRNVFTGSVEDLQKFVL